jgi:integrase
MGVKIRKKRGKLYLDIYQSGTRKWEALHLTLTGDKNRDKEIFHIAEKCRCKRELQLTSGAWDIQNKIDSNVTLVKYMEDHAKSYKNPSIILCCIKHLKNFNCGCIQINQLTIKWVENFQNYLLPLKQLSRYTAGFYMRVLRSILNKAVTEGIIAINPAKFVRKLLSPEPELQFLDFNEVKALASVKIDGTFSPEFRRAFLFACYTGLRISDIETLTWSQVRTNPMQIIKIQEKTQSNVFIPLSRSAQALIIDGKKHTQDEKIFKFTIHNRRASYKHLQKWAGKANLHKKIGWHTARRTFATMVLTSGADIFTVSKLLGHVGLTHVTKYAKITDKTKIDAINAMPQIAI